MQPAIYILSSQRNGTLYIGVTGNLRRRLEIHRSGGGGFTKRYGFHRLVYFEFHADMRSAILRETRIKRWRRAWKVDLIERVNPTWRDLATDLF